MQNGKRNEPSRISRVSNSLVNFKYSVKTDFSFSGFILIESLAVCVKKLNKIN